MPRYTHLRGYLLLPLLGKLSLDPSIVPSLFPYPIYGLKTFMLSLDTCLLKCLSCISCQIYKTICKVKNKISVCKKAFLASNFGDISLGIKMKEF